MSRDRVAPPSDNRRASDTRRQGCILIARCPDESGDAPFAEWPGREGVCFPPRRSDARSCKRRPGYSGRLLPPYGSDRVTSHNSLVLANNTLSPAFGVLTI